MLKKTYFLAGVVAMILIISPISATYAHAARSVTERDINNQELEVKNSSRLALEQYTRLLLYMIIFRLESRLSA